MLHVAGQTAADDESGVAAGNFVEQFETALARTLEVVRAAGGRPQDVVRMTIYVTNLDEYRSARSSLSDVWRRHLGTHYPAMALVGVTGLVDRGAIVEIQADAVLPIKEPLGRRRRRSRSSATQQRGLPASLSTGLIASMR